MAILWLSIDAPKGKKPAVVSLPSAASRSEPEVEITADVPMINQPSTGHRFYRTQEKNRIVAALLASSSILAVGEEGIGKTTLCNAVVEELRVQDFPVCHSEPATTKQVLTEIAEQLEIETTNISGKQLTTDGLKLAIANYLETNTAFLVFDDAHQFEPKFRGWLKYLKRKGQPMLLLATAPPKTDIFLNIPSLIIKPLPEYAVREIMEQTALERGINLQPNELAKLQSRAGGNPMLAQRSIDEEYLGLENETGDHRRYYDATPLLLLVGILFVATRFIAMGTSNQSLYVMTGIGGAVFMGLSRVIYRLPKESGRITG